VSCFCICVAPLHRVLASRLHWLALLHGVALLHCIALLPCAFSPCLCTALLVRFWIALASLYRAFALRFRVALLHCAFALRFALRFYIALSRCAFALRFCIALLHWVFHRAFALRLRIALLGGAFRLHLGVVRFLVAFLRRAFDWCLLVAPLRRALTLCFGVALLGCTIGGRIALLDRTLASRRWVAPLSCPIGLSPCIALLDRALAPPLGRAIASCCWIAVLSHYWVAPLCRPRAVGSHPCVALLGCALASCYWVAAPLRPAIGSLRPCVLLLGHAHFWVTLLGRTLASRLWVGPCIALLGRALALCYWVLHVYCATGSRPPCFCW
jgi:hypothetical protein